MKNYLGLLIIFMTLLFSVSISAMPMLMARSTQPAEIVMDGLQKALQDYGYSIANVQRCDGGLSDFDYKTDYYRVVFFGKIEEVRPLTEKYPELIPYLPLRILVFAENEETVLSTFNPMDLAQYFDDPSLTIQFMRWHSDMSAILNELRIAK